MSAQSRRWGAGRTVGRDVLRQAALAAVERVESRLLMSTYTVNTTSDAANPGAGLLSLRQAVAAANAHAGADTVAFSAAVFGTSQSIVLAQGPIAITDPTGATTVAGPGAALLSVNGNGAGRVFTTAAGTTVTLSGLTITGGKQTVADAAGNTYGGGIYSAGSLTLANDAVTANSVVASGIEPASRTSTTLGSGYGGGVYATGPLAVTGSTLTGNTVVYVATIDTYFTNGGGAAGGAIYGTGAVSLTNASVAGNSVAGADHAGVRSSGTPGETLGAGGAAAGGGLFAGGAMTVTQSSVTGNTADGGSGDYFSTGGGAFGGGLFGAAGVTVTSSTVAGNGAVAGSSGGADGPTGAGQGGGIYAGGTVTVNGSTVTQNKATAGNFETANLPTAGGGIYAAGAANLSADTVGYNTVVGAAAYPTVGPAIETVGGGGLYVVGPLSLGTTTVTHNVASAVLDGPPPQTIVGGGVVTLGRSTITGSTLDTNSVTGGNGYQVAAYGGSNADGRDAAGGGLYAAAPVTITNSTIVNNVATGANANPQATSDPAASGGNGVGGGLYVTAGLTLADSTVSGNASMAGAGISAGYAGTAAAGGLDAAGGTVTLTNSILAGNFAGGVANDMAGTFSFASNYNVLGLGGNLLANPSATRGNQFGVLFPELLPLGNYGGPTQTEVPLAGSPAIDAGSNALVPAGVTTDQRGAARIYGPAVDVGAVEVATGGVTGVVFIDGNADGKQDNGEIGFGGVHVFADANGNGQYDAGEASVLTDGTGKYTLGALPPHTYLIDVQLPAGTVATTPTSASVTVAVGQTATGPTFGVKGAGAPVYIVNTTLDLANPTPGMVTLREAAFDLNAASGGGTIEFDPAVFTAANHTITLTQGPIAFTNTTGPLSIAGPGAALAVVSGGGAGRVFTTAAGTTVQIAGITITGGKQTVADAAGNTYGGAIYSAGNLTLFNDTVTGNAVVADGFGPPVYAGSNDGQPGMGEGGAVYATGPLTITSSTLSGNTVTNKADDVNSATMLTGGGAAGGAVYGTSTVTITTSTLTGNTASGTNPGGADGGAAAGGAVFAGGALTVTGSTVTGNVARGGNGNRTDNGGGAFGGGLFGNGAVTIGTSTVTGNAADAGNSGDVNGTSGVAQGGGIYAGGTVVVTGSTVSNDSAVGGNFDPEGFGQGTFTGRTPSAGGGLYAGGAATLSADTFAHDAVTGGPSPFQSTAGLTAAGGGAYVVGTVSLSTSTFSGDSATGGGSEVTAAGVGGSGAGGGLAVLGKATITGSTLDHDSAAGGPGYSGGNEIFAGGGGYGGGIYAPSSAVTITNSTIIDDTAVGGVGGSSQQAGADGGPAAGGGLWVGAGLTLADSTVSGNVATPGAPGQPDVYEYPSGNPGTATAGGLDAAGGTVTLTNSVVSGNTAAGASNDVVGTLSAASGYDLIGVGGNIRNGVNGNKVGITNPMLSDLGYNGGATQTELPLPGSPLIDAGRTALVPAGVTTDQRGNARVVGSSVDIGATEYAASSATGTVTGTVFNDANANGVQDAAEGGLGGLTVYADVNRDGRLDAGDVSAVTSANGSYTLTGLPAGQYPLTIVFANGYRATTATSRAVGVGAGETLAGPSFGQTTAALISGAAFVDQNGDGKMDGTDAAAVNVTIYIDSNGDGKYEAPERSVLTSSAGNWSFGLLAPGTYTIRVDSYATTVTTPAAGSFTFAVGNGSTRTGNVFGIQYQA